MVWGIFFGWVWEGLGKVRQGRKMNIFKNVQEGFSRVGTPGNSSLVTKIEERNTQHFFFSTHIFYGIINILSARGRRQGALALRIRSSPKVSLNSPRLAAEQYLLD